MNLAVAPPPAWMADGACTEPGTDPELWHPVAERDPAVDAKQICGGCPVMEACGVYALARPALEGVWGGLTFPERRAIHRRQLRAGQVGTARPRGANSAASAGVRRRMTT